MRFFAKFSVIIVIGLCSAALIEGCATTFVPPSKATPAGADRIYAPKSMLQPFPGCSVMIVTRGNGTMDGAGARIGFDIDGKPAASIWPGEKAKFYLKPGVHMLTFDHPGIRGGQQIYTQQDKATIYSMSLGFMGAGGERFVPRIVPNQNSLAKECHK